MLRCLKAVIIIQGGDSSEIPFRDPDPQPPLPAIQEDGNGDVEKWLRLADVALTNKRNLNPTKHAA